MKTLSKTQYENETNPYDLTDKLVDISLSNIYFAKAAINIAKSVQHLVAEKDKEVSLRAIETAEKYLRGEVTQEECKKIADTAHSAFHIVVVSAASAAAASASASAAAAFAATYVAEIYADRAAYNAYRAAYNAARAAASAAGVYAASTRVIGCDMLRQAIPWNLVCSFQIAKCFRNEKDEQFIQNIMKDEKLINYATILIEDENLRKEFQFFMKDYMNK